MNMLTRCRFSDIGFPIKRSNVCFPMLEFLIKKTQWLDVVIQMKKIHWPDTDFSMLDSWWKKQVGLMSGFQWKKHAWPSSIFWRRISNSKKALVKLQFSGVRLLIKKKTCWPDIGFETSSFQWKKHVNQKSDSHWKKHIGLTLVFQHQIPYEKTRWLDIGFLPFHFQWNEHVGPTSHFWCWIWMKKTCVTLVFRCWISDVKSM